MHARKNIFLAGCKHPDANILCTCLEYGLFEVEHEERIGAALPRIVQECPDVVLLDVRRGDRTGLDLCAELRSLYEGMIVIYMDYEDEHDQVTAYESGADDIVIKPISPRVLIARMHALLNRVSHMSFKGDHQRITIGDLTVDAGRREAYLKETPLYLTTLQFDLLWYLVQNAGRIVTRDNLSRALFATDYNGVDRAVDVYISRIRQKLNDNPANPNYLKTVRGLGYLFVAA